MDVVQWLTLCQLLVDRTLLSLGSEWFFGGMVEFVFATSGNKIIGNFQGRRKISSHSNHSVPAVRRDPQQTKGESLLAIYIYIARLFW
jgi:hypothetical protein